mmetsp:Transcript_6977/g.10005  ORF Transcript_6977/g.10005 Transcript_6977/m.10005 type:complete len:221 (-) Transcript_6977:474-1136(-)
MLSSSASRAAGVSNSATRPSSRTNTLSLSIMVLSRCAIVNTVASAKLARIIFWITASVVLSILAVASSNTRIFGFLKRERAIQRSCRCPCEKFSPPSATCSSRPLSRELIASSSSTFLRMLHSSSSLAVSNGSKLYRTVFENMTGSWGMILKFSRSVCVPISPIFTPSISMHPFSCSISEIRKRAIIKLLFPLPVLPTTPTFSPPLIVTFKSFKTRGPSR